METWPCMLFNIADRFAIADIHQFSSAVATGHMLSNPIPYSILPFSLHSFISTFTGNCLLALFSFDTVIISKNMKCVLIYTTL